MLHQNFRSRTDDARRKITAAHRARQGSDFISKTVLLAGCVFIASAAIRWWAQ